MQTDVIEPGTRRSATLDDGIRVLDHTRERMLDGDVEAAYRALVRALFELRWRLGERAWGTFVHDVASAHPLFAMFGQDPMIRHCRAKPRGYAGDARLLDMIYDGVTSVEGEPLSELGRRLFDCGFRAAPSRAVRERAARLSRAIDGCVARGGTRVLAVACGHLRELEHAVSVRDGAIERFVALDQDAESLAVVDRCHGHLGVETVQRGVRELLRRPAEAERFDLVYAAGLYDYLGAPFARRLTSALFDRVAPGGRLLLANFMPSNPSIGHMDAMMQWPLIYRTPLEMEALPDPDVPGTIDVHADSIGVVTYLEISRP